MLDHERARLGAEHQDVLELRHQLAMLRASSGPDAAIDELTSLLEDERRMLGPGHRLVADLTAQLRRLRGRRDGAG